MNPSAAKTSSESAQNGREPNRESDPQVIVLIHGTGAASKSDEGDQWWQRGSAFTRLLDSRTLPFAKCLDSAEIFHWSGYNSERDRRSYGQRLYEQFIKPFEKQCRPYHLIGHSHGGGVILGALIEAVRQNHRLEYLRSWSTFGTPFLFYRARVRHWTVVLPIIALLISLIWLIPIGIQYFSYRTELLGTQSLTAVILPPLLVGLPLVIGVLVVLAWAVALFRRALSVKYAALRRRAVAEYGDRWLGIASASDEAVNGLRSTLTLRSNVAWRLPSRRDLGLFLKIILMPVEPLIWFYNTFIAAAADEFIWSLTTRRLQGSDLQGQTLTAVSQDLEHGAFEVTRLAPEVEAEIVAHANAYSVGALANVRSVLGLASQSSDSGQALLAGFKKGLTWQELIHTSYLMYTTIRELLARHILERLKPDTRKNDTSPLASLSPPGPLAAPALPRLSTVINLSLVAVVGLTALLGIVVTRAFVRPYTDQFQVEAIWNELHDPEIGNPHGVSIGLASLLGAHALIVGDGKDEGFASNIRSSHTKPLAMEWVAEADALANRLAATQALLKDMGDLPAAGDAAAAVYRQLSLSGNCADAGIFLPSALKATADPDDFRRKLLVAEGLKACNQRQKALELIRNAVVAVKPKPWLAQLLMPDLARLDEEDETTAAIGELFQTSSERSHQFIAAATIFMSQGNTDAASRLLSRAEPDNINQGDSGAALKLYAQLDNVAAIDRILSRSVPDCHELAELGEVFLRRNAKSRVEDIERLMIGYAQALPVRGTVAECLLDVSLLQNSSGNVTDAKRTFAAATELIGQIPNDNGFRTSLSALAAEVALRWPLDHANVSEWLGRVTSDADSLPPGPAFRMLIRLADVALSVGAKDDLRTILQNAEEAIARDTEYQSRAPNYRRLAERYAAAGWYREGRLIAERSVIGDERLRAFTVIVWHIVSHDHPLLPRLLGVSKDDEGDVVLTDISPDERKRAEKDDEKQMLTIGLGPVCPSQCTTGR